MTFSTMAADHHYEFANIATDVAALPPSTWEIPESYNCGEVKTEVGHKKENDMPTMPDKSSPSSLASGVLGALIGGALVACVFWFYTAKFGDSASRLAEQQQQQQQERAAASASSIEL
jgi:hypothetical protein